jgi:rhamnosyltransferase
MTLVAGVVVTFRPDLKKLDRLLLSLAVQLDHVIVVDNGSGEEVGDWIRNKFAPSQVAYMPQFDNRGIGAAQNVGIRGALERGATHVALFDQDSAPCEGMILELLRGEDALLKRGLKVGAVGPVLYDEASGAPLPFVHFTRGIKRWVDPSATLSKHVETHHLVSSGTLVRGSVWRDVGMMREDLFLEYVDVEWGLRARAKGYVSYGIIAAGMVHNLGDNRATVFFGLASVPLHAPIRHYYTVRNAIWMQRASYVPLYWKVQDLARTVFGVVFFALRNPPRLQQVRMMLRGARDGFASRLGRFET